MTGRTSFYFAPLIAFGFIWCMSLWMHFNNPYNYLIVSSETQSILFTGIFSVIIGYFLVHVNFLEDFLKKKNQTRIEINENRLCMTIISMSSLIVIGIMLTLSVLAGLTDGLSLYIENPLRARSVIVGMQVGEITDYNHSVYRMGSYLISLLYPVSVLAGFQFSRSKTRRWVSFIPMILTLAVSAVFIKRFTLFTISGLWFISAFYTMHFQEAIDRQRIRRNLITIAMAALLMIFGFSYWIISLRAFVMSNILDYFIENVYSYFAGTLSAFEKFYITKDHETLTMGASSFRSIFKWLARLGLADKSLVQEVHSSFVNIGKGHAQYLNTYTFVKALYEDFGIIGVSIFSMIWGGLTRFLIQKLKEGFSLLFLMGISVLSFSLIMTFYEFYFEGLSAIVLWFIMMGLMNFYLVQNRILLIENRES